MNKLEKYALHSALKPQDAQLNECFFPVKEDKYITYNINTNSTSKFYFHWQEVVNLIQPYLQKQGVSILKIGNPNTPQVLGTINYSGKSFNQNNYILKKSLLHFNAFDYFSYICDQMSKPNVSLFSSFPSASYNFKDYSNKIFIDSPKGDKNPSLIENETPKTIDLISPTQVAYGILKLLNIDNDLNNYNCIHFGESAHLKMIEVIPDFQCDPTFYPGAVINVRADLCEDQEFVASFLSSKRQVGLITKKSFGADFLHRYRSFLNKVIIYIDDRIDQDFILNLKKFNIKYQLVCINEKEIGRVRSENLDEEIELWNPSTKKDLDISSDICNNLFFNTSKTMHSKSGIFSSKAHWIVNEQKESMSKVIDAAGFWEDSDFYYIYEKN